MTDHAEVIRILIADDHTIFRDGLKNLLSREPAFRVVGEASSGSDALEMTDRLRPDILLLDMEMPKVGGMEVLRALQGSHTPIKTIVLSGIVEADQVSGIFELGARGLVLKDSATDYLFKGIRSVMAGKYWIGQKAVGSLVKTLKECKGAAKSAHPNNYGLTPREFEVIRAVVSGYPNKEIAALMAISEQTVKHHITNIFDKLGVYNRLELTLFVFHHGLVENSHL